MGEEHEEYTGLMARHLSSESGGMEEYVVDGSAREVARRETREGFAWWLFSILCVCFFMVWEMYLLENVEGE